MLYESVSFSAKARIGQDDSGMCIIVEDIVFEL